MYTAFRKVLSLFQRMHASFFMRCCSNPTTRQDHLSHTKIRLFNKTVDCKMFLYMQIVFYQSMKYKMDDKSDISFKISQ